MSIATLILGSSGSGKTTSLRNLDPKRTLLVQPIRKSLPFRSAGWTTLSKDGGNIMRTDDPARIEEAMRKSPFDIVVIDDFQALMVHEMMARSSETGFQKFTDIGKLAWNLFKAAGTLEDHRRVYILAHTQTDDFGNVRMKTVGKLVDSQIVPEGYFTIVLRTEVVNGEYKFATQTNGQDCAKSPIGMFADRHIDNDLAIVDRAICDFYSLEQPA